MRPFKFLCSVLFLLALATPSFAQTYTSIVVFGDSLSDVGNLAHLTQAKYGITARVPGPVANYADGRATDGLQTLPPARNYTGIWIEQLAAGFASKPAIVNSLDGGTNYAYAYASTGPGTSSYTFGPGNTLAVDVNNMQQQVTDYLSTRPVINNKTLFVVWGGANSLIAAKTPADITNAALQDLAVIQTLIAAGGTDFLVPNLPPLGAVPRFNGSQTLSVPATQASVGYNQALAAGLAALPAANPSKTIHLFPLDVFSLFTGVIAQPAASGLVNVTASSQFNAAVNPDGYLFWDDLHPTTAGHHLFAQAAALLLTPLPVSTTTTLTSSPQNGTVGASVTFTATVIPGSGTAVPTGSVTFSEGSNTLGTANVVSGTGVNGTAAYSTSSLGAGTHTITATFTGVNGFSNSTSIGYSIVVSQPALLSALSPTSLTLASGATGTSTVTLTPTGGLSGTATLACGTVPAHFSCSFSPSSLNFTASSSTPQTSTLTLTTKDASTSINRKQDPTAPMVAWIGAPFAAMLLYAARKRSGAARFFCFAAFTMLIGVVGCGGSSSNNANKGTYSIPVNITSAGSTTTLNLTVVVQ